MCIYNEIADDTGSFGYLLLDVRFAFTGWKNMPSSSVSASAVLTLPYADSYCPAYWSF